MRKEANSFLVTVFQPLEKPSAFCLVMPLKRKTMLLELLANIVGPIAEKRSPALRAAVKSIGALLLTALALYIAYAFLAP